MNKNPVSRLELKFWNFAIDVLSLPVITRSNEKRFQRSTLSSTVVSLAILVGMSGVAGLFAGYAFYYLAFVGR
jgi:hypothetical protein